MSVIVGVLLAILAYSMLNIGQALQKKGADELPQIEDQNAKQNFKNFLTNKIWLIGWILSTIQWYIWLIALNFAPLSLITPMMGIGLVVLAIFSYFYLNEKISLTEIIGIVFIIIGVALLGIYTQQNNATYTLEEINTLFSRSQAIIFTLILFILVIAPMSYSKARNYKYADVMFGFAAGVLAGLGSLYSKAMMGGIGTGPLIDTLKSWQWWIYVVFVIIGNMGMLAVQQVGFQKGKAIIVTPITSILNLVLGVLSGIIIFSEWNGEPLTNIIIKSVALIIVVAGVSILSLYSTLSQSKETKNEGE
ncbi:MAG: DMT family transporter [Promethearchaeota archaeon]